MVKLEVGADLTQLPEWSTPLQPGEGTPVKLSDYVGTKSVILFFFPRANTSGCTKEVCAFRDEFSRFEKVDAQILGISSDSPEKLAGFAQNQRAPYPLLSDKGGVMRKALGIKGNLFGVVPGRETFVISKEGKLLHRFNDQLNATKHVTESLRILESQA